MSSDISQFVGEDSRKPIERLRRYQLHRLADGFKLPYPPGASKDVMIKLFEANNLDVTQSPDVQWQAINGVDSNGNHTQEFYPVEQLHGSMRNGANAALALNERLSAKEEEENTFKEARLDVLQRENEQLRRDNEQIKGVLEERLAALENEKPPVDKDSPQANFWAKYREARDLNLPVERGMKLPQIEAMIATAKEKVDG